MKPSSCLLLLLLAIPLIVSGVMAADTYKPYLHQPKVPDSPQVRLFGQYATDLYPGAATYTYAIDTPKGVDGLQPTVFLSYSSQAVKRRLGIVGAGWSLNQDMVYRDVNGTQNTTDDRLFLVLDNHLYPLVNVSGTFHTEVDYWFRIQNNATYWTVTKQDGTQYRFGYTNDSNVTSNTGLNYTVKWLLDQVQDTHGNTISYSYVQNPYAEDAGSAYLTSIRYNSDQLRVIGFTYENATRPDRRRVYDQGNVFEESRRLTDVTVTVSGSLVRREHLTYSTLSSSLTAVSAITRFGSDNTSSLYTISFGYSTPSPGYTNTTLSKAPTGFETSTHADSGARLLDINNDGFIDIVKRIQSGDNNAWLSDKQGNWSVSSVWTVPTNIVDSSNKDLGVRFEDVNRDGLVDVLSAKAGTRAVYLSNGSGWNLSSWSLPVDFVDASSIDQGTQLVDVNGDGLTDIIQSKAGSRSVYLNNGTGWVASSLTFPTDFVDGSGVDQGTRLADVNGDGLPDVIQELGTGSPVHTIWLNNGTGWSSGTWSFPASLNFVETLKPDTGVRLADLDGDGLVDIMVSYANTTTNSSAWINNGTGWVQNSTWAAPETFVKVGFNTARRLADVNGDGFADLMVAENTTQYTYLKNQSIPYLLSSITSEYGGVTTVNYTTSTQFNNTVNKVSQIGFNVFVVSNMTKNNSLSGAFNAFGVVSYNYSYGAYNYNKSEFRGFGLTTETKPTSMTQHSFYQDDARRGREYQTAVYDTNGALFSVNIRDFNAVFDSGVYNLSLRSEASYLYDGLPTAIVTNKSYQYNVYGNPQYVTDYGDIAVSGDERYYNTSYGFDTVDWIINKVSRSTTYDANLTKVKETKYYYDGLGINGVGPRGDLTKTEQWASDGNNSYTYFTYDTHGNLLTKTDSLGNTYTYHYDPLNVFVIGTVNPLGHVMSYTYDAGTGNMLSTTTNGIATNRTYDVFGRVSMEVRPYDTTDLPTKRYTYAFDGVAPEEISVALRTTANNTQVAHYFYDGFADLVQAQSDLESATDVKNIFYDAELRAGAEQNPYFANSTGSLLTPSTSVNTTNYTYDALGRVTFVRNADGTNKTTAYQQYNITDYDENGHRHRYVLDGRGNIAQVNEYNLNALGGLVTYTTTYGYDGNDNLAGITDNEHNEFSFVYDSLGRKVAMSDPDMGNWSYRYDTNSNLANQTDSRGSIVSLVYDDLNRLVQKTSDDVNVTLGYDGQYYGTLSEQAQGADFVNYTYDKRFRAIHVTQNVSGSVFDQDILYDAQDRIISDNGMDFLYNLQGLVETIPGYVNDSTYNPFGSLATRIASNGVVTTYTYNTANNRLLTITAPAVQNLSYTYDNVGNILSIQDGITSQTSTMGYDYLDRLTNATIGSDRYLYSYNSLGNIMKLVKNNASTKMAYTGLAHAPSVVIQDAAGVDVAEPHELNTSSKRRIFEATLVNDNNATTSTNLSVDFGNASSITSQVNVSGPVIALIQGEYAFGGDYGVNFSTTGVNSVDWQVMPIKFGTRAQLLDVLQTNISQKTFEFIIHNDVNESVSSVGWSCNELSSVSLANLTGNQSMYTIIAYNYSSAGSKAFSCNATSNDGDESALLPVVIPSLSIAEYNVLSTNTSRRIVEFGANNAYYDLLTNVSTSTDDINASQLANISNGATLFVITETNYSTDNAKQYAIALAANGSTTGYADRFTLQGVSVQNYVRVANNFTNQILLFDVINNWNHAAVNWTVANPSVNGTANLSAGEHVAVVIENAYTQQDAQKAEVSAIASSYTTRVSDLFSVHPLEITAFVTLYEEYPIAVSEILARNNLNVSQLFDWLYTGQTTIRSNYSMNLTNGSARIIISAPNNGAQHTSAYVNSSTYTDTEDAAATS